jgi:hypothetical protein
LECHILNYNLTKTPLLLNYVGLHYEEIKNISLTLLLMNGTDLESDRTLLSGLMILITMVTGNVIDMLNFYPRKIFVRNIVSNKMKNKNYHTVGTVDMPYPYRGRDLPMQSVHITTNVVSSNPALAMCTRCNIM